jgi:hypothetical protein
MTIESTARDENRFDNYVRQSISAIRLCPSEEDTITSKELTQRSANFAMLASESWNTAQILNWLLAVAITLFPCHFQWPNQKEEEFIRHFGEKGQIFLRSPSIALLTGNFPPSKKLMWHGNS